LAYGWLLLCIMEDVYIVTIVIALCFTTILLLGWKLNVLSMGDDEARALGVNPEKYKIILKAMATLMTSITLSISGIIPWVGLMMSHAARMILGPDHRFLLPGAALLGGSYLLICDTPARTLTSSEIHMGIIASLLGAPYLFCLLRTRGKYLEC
jgi:iron complex transport system permease protein